MNSGGTSVATEKKYARGKVRKEGRGLHGEISDVADVRL